MKEYFLNVDGKEVGPFDLEQLKYEKVGRTTPVWYEGLADWTPAGELPELEILFLKKSPPPFKEKGELYEKKSKTKDPIQPKKKWVSVLKISLWVFGVFVLISLAIELIAEYSNYDNPQNYNEKVFSVGEIERSNPTRFLSIDGQWNENFLGTKFVIKGSIQNIATVAGYKDVNIVVKYYTKTNTLITTESYVLYEFFQPNSKNDYELRVPYYKNTAKLNWEIVSATPY